MLERLKHQALALPRPLKRGTTVLFDIVVLLGVVWVSYSLRLARQVDPQSGAGCCPRLCRAADRGYPVFIRMAPGLYRHHHPLPAGAGPSSHHPCRAMLLATVCWAALLFLTAMYGVNGAPRSVPVLFFVLGTVVIAGSLLRPQALAWRAVAAADINR